MLQNDKGEFLEAGYKIIKSTTDLFDKKQQHIKRKHVLNDLASFLRDREMLPAIGFVFSRKQVEMCAHEITVPLLEDDSKVGYNVRRECEQIIRKFTNYQEYLELPEYNDLVSLLEKGIGIHHSGMIPVLREIVELMISKKYIKLLFATESFAIGLDCPIKTAIFTGLMKFDGNTERQLMSHEYTQMAGRAGRRGIDSIGYVVHCNNLFSLPSKTDYCEMLGGRPQGLVSKFRISYSLILNLLKNGKTRFHDFVDFVNNSMVQGEITDAIEKQKVAIVETESNFKNKEKSVSNLQTPIDICEHYLQAETNLKTSVNKKRKEMEKTLSEIEFQYRFIKSDVLQLKAFYVAKTDYENEVTYLTTLENHIFNELNKVVEVLSEQGFVQLTDDVYTLTEKGTIASGIAEIHPLVTAELFHMWNWFQDFSVDKLIGLLAVFTDVKIDEDSRSWQIKIDDSFLNTRLKKVIKEYSFYEKLEDDRGIKTGINYLTALNYDMPELLMEWIETHSQEDCKWFIQTRLQEKGISLGDFTKAVMKISTIAKEWSNVAEQRAQIELLHKLTQIDGKILKYVTTAQSLYV
jgi:superfamily II RNA helicase